MSRRNKLQRFADLLAFPNVYENLAGRSGVLNGVAGSGLHLAGSWATGHFKKEGPLVVELGCGYGEYAVVLARENPEKLFVGVDCKGARIWKGAKTGLRENLSNLAFLRTRIELITLFFGAQEISEIWITFPDPFPENHRIRRRLTAPAILQQYRQILKPEGMIHLKTDDLSMYQYTLDTLAGEVGAKVHAASIDIYRDTLPHPLLAVRTRYENQFLAVGKTIKYLRFSL